MRRRYFITGKFILIAALAFVSGLTAHAQQLKIKTAFDSTSILIGDQVMLHVEIDQPANAKVTLPVFSDTLTSKIEIVRISHPDSIKKDGLLHIKQDILVTSFDSGYHQVPPIAFPYTMGQAKDTLHSTALFLKVTTLPVDSLKDIHDIKAPLNAPFSILDYWPFIAGWFALLIMVLVIVLIIRRKKKGYLFGPPKPLEPPHVIALRELDALRNEKLWQNNKIKPYYTQLTEIIRTYIEKRFGINALEMTSEEIIVALKKLNFDNEGHISLLHKMFMTSDLVKFAKAEPLPNENETNLLDAYQFVNNTKPAIPSPMEVKPDDANNNALEEIKNSELTNNKTIN